VGNRLVLALDGFTVAVPTSSSLHFPCFPIDSFEDYSCAQIHCFASYQTAAPTEPRLGRLVRIGQWLGPHAFQMFDLALFM